MQACLRDAFDPNGRMNPSKVLPDGARCGEFAAAHDRRARARSRRARRSDPPAQAHDVEEMRAATADGRRSSVSAGAAPRQGEPGEVDAELWTTSLDRVVAYDPAEMLCVVEAGMRLGELRRLLADGGQEWPVDEPDDATVGGVIAADVPLPRQLRVGCLRDTVVEMASSPATGDGSAAARAR